MICQKCGHDSDVPLNGLNRAETRQLTIRAESVLAFLNHKTGKHFQSEVNVDLIRQRLKGGATEEQCRAVIARKVREWTGDEKMERCLRPATLFARKNFAQYLGDLPATAFKASPEMLADADW